MQNKAQDQSSVSLANGLMIRGSYAYSQGGLHVHLYLVNPVGNILANRSYGFAKRVSDAHDIMVTLLGALKQICFATKLDQITQPRIQEAAAKAIMLALTKQAVFKKAA